MICSLDRNKVSSAISDKVSEVVSSYNSFIKEGEELVPIEGTEWEKNVKEINNLFQGEVLTKVHINRFKINIPASVVDRYIFSQQDSFIQVQEALRQEYLKQFSTEGLNLLTPDMWLNHPILENPTTQKLMEFAKKINPNFQIGEFENLNESAVSLIRDYIIVVREGKFLDELPEEIAHFFVALLPEDHPSFVGMMKDITNYPIYGQTYDQYKGDPMYMKDGRPNIEKIKKEAIGKLISQYIQNAFEGTADEQYKGKRNRLKEFISQIIKYLRKAFYKASGQLYAEPVMPKNFFDESAQAILKGDVSMLNLKKTIDPYDSVFYSKMEENREESYEGSTIAKALHSFSKSVKITLKKNFFTFLDTHELTGLKDALSDNNYNRIWDAIHLLSEAEKDFGFLADQSNANLDLIARITDKLSDAYHEMEQVAIHMENILAELRTAKKNGTINENELVNKIKEIQNYLSVSNTFKNIGDQFTELLTYIKSKEDRFGDEFPFFKGTFEKMLNSMGSTKERFKAADNDIYDILRDHLLDLTDHWTKELFQKYTDERQELFDKSETERRRLQLKKHIVQHFSSREQLSWALNGDFPNKEKLERMFGEGKWDISKMKDITGSDYMLFMFGATSTMGDPFVSNAIAFYVDKVLAHRQESRNEQIKFADKITPFLKKLSKLGLGYYDAQKKIQQVEKFFDTQSEDNTFERRTLLSATNRFEFQYERQVLKNAIKELEKDRTALAVGLGDLTDDKKALATEEIKKLNGEIEAKRKELEEFNNKYSHRDYTDEFYEKIAFLRENAGDGTILRELKDIEKQIIHKQDQITEVTLNQFTTEDQSALIEELAKLQARKLVLKDQLPQRDKDAFNVYEELYEQDVEATKRVVERHKRAFIRRYVKYNLDKGKTREELEELAEDGYEATYIVHTPTQEFWDERTEVIEEIKKLVGNEHDYTRVLAERMEELDNKKRKLLGSIRNFRNEVSVHAVQNNTVPNSTKRLYDELADIEDELKVVRVKLKILSSIENKIGGKNPQDVAKVLSVTVDVFFAFEQVVRHDLSEDRIQNTLGKYFKMNSNIAAGIKNSMQKVLEGKAHFQDIVKQLEPIDENSKVAKSKLEQMQSIVDVAELEQKLLDGINDWVKVNSVTRDKLQVKYKELEELSGKNVSLDYMLGPLRIINDTLTEIMKLPNSSTLTNALNMDIIEAKAAAISGKNYLLEDSKYVEQYLSDGFLKEIIRYLRIKSEVDPNDTTSEETANYLEAIHTGVIKEGQEFTTPREYLKTISPKNPAHSKSQPVYFLQRNRVRDQYRTEQIFETDPRVIAGTHKATVDINGEWLPKEDKDSKFFNKEYDRMKNSTDEQDKTLFAMLQEFKLEYLKRQQELIPEGQRLDLVIPARMNDQFEGMVLHLKNFSEWGKNLKEFFTLKKHTNDAEAINYNEELGIATKQNREIYTGAIINEAGVKLNSRRRIPVQRVSEDVLANMLFFIDDTHEYAAKNFVAPIFKSFADVFKVAHQQNPNANKTRAQVFHDLLNTKIYNIAPDNLANNPALARFLTIVNKFATMKLLADPLGAMVNLVGGQLQMLIEAHFDKKEYAEWGKALATATAWSTKYVQETFSQQNLSKETQFVNAFAFLPEETDISQRVSKTAIASDVRSALMFPRSITEVEMGIQLGLSIIRTIPIEHNGKNYKFEEIYEKDKDTGLLELIPEFKNDEELNKKYNLVDGTEVAKARRKVVQKYTLIQGNFYDFNADYISNTALGRSAELMKRWFITGYTRRLQGRVLDPMTGEERLGMHRAMLDLLNEVIWALNPFSSKASIKTLKDFWLTRPKADEVAFRRALAEIMWLVIAGIILTYALGYDDDDKDRAKKVKEMGYWQQMFLLMSLRVESELGTFIPLPVWGLGLNETKRAFLDPISTIRGTVDNIVAMSAMLVYHLQYALGDDDVKGQLFYKKTVGGKTTGSFLWGGISRKTLFPKDEADSKGLALLLNTLGYTGYTVKPSVYIQVLSQMQNKLK